MGFNATVQAFLNSDSVKAVFNQTNSALSAITVLKKICDHPALLSKRAEKGIVSGGQSRAASFTRRACLEDDNCPHSADNGKGKCEFG